MRYLKILLLTSLIASSYALAQEADTPPPTNLDKLLELVKEGEAKEQAANRKREAEFKAKADQQNEILRELAKQERISDQLEAEFKKNQEKLRIAEEAYLKRLGSLNELPEIFLKQADNLKASLEASYTGAEFGKDREEFLKDLIKRLTQLPTIEEMERVWYEIMREMKATGEVSRFSANVINVDGTQTKCDVIRAGNLAALCGIKYLEYLPEMNMYRIIDRQPGGYIHRFGLKSFDKASEKGEFTLIYIDPRRILNGVD